MIRAILILVLFSSSCIGSENLEEEDLIGLWHSDHPTTSGETNQLRISNTWNVSFTRNFGGRAPTQMLVAASDAVHLVEGLFVIDLSQEGETETYKLSLSGWKSGSTRALFGTIYMYRQGVLFNGLPITFRFEEDDS